MGGYRIGSMPLRCWVYTVVAKTCFDNLLNLTFIFLHSFNLILYCFPSFWLFICHLRCAWQFLHGKYAPVLLFYFCLVWFFCLKKKNKKKLVCFCVFVMENPFSQSPPLFWLLYILSDLLSCSSSVCAVVCCDAVHCNSSLTLPPPSPTPRSLLHPSHYGPVGFRSSRDVESLCE